SSDRPAGEAPVSFWSMAALPGAAGVVLGLAPFLLDALVGAAAGAAGGRRSEVLLVLWHGVNAALVISAVALGAGAVVIGARRRIEAVLQARTFPFSALAVVDATRRGIIALGAKVAAPTASNAPARHLAVPMVMVVVIS